MSIPAKPLSPPLQRRAQKAFPPLVVEELTRLEEALGGRQALVGTLTLAPLNADLRYILGLLGDPRCAGKSLAELCVQGNILPAELLHHIQNAALLKGKVLASQKIGEGIAAVTEDLMKRAAPYDAPCYACRGLGMLPPAEPTPAQPNPQPEPCETCASTGMLRYAPDLDRQKLALELAHLLPKGGGLQILNQQISGGGAAGTGFEQGSLAKLQRLTDTLLYGSTTFEPPSIVEGELSSDGSDHGSDDTSSDSSGNRLPPEDSDGLPT